MYSPRSGLLHGDLCAAARPLGFGPMRDLEVIDTELRLLAAVRRVCREQDGILPSIGPRRTAGRTPRA